MTHRLGTLQKYSAFSLHIKTKGMHNHQRLGQSWFASSFFPAQTPRPPGTRQAAIEKKRLVMWNAPFTGRGSPTGLMIPVEQRCVHLLLVEIH